MAKTFAQLNAEIEVLKAKADAARRKEAAGVVARIKEAIVAYGLTAQDLGFGRSDGGRGVDSKKTATGSAPKKQRVQDETKVAVKYRDSVGNTWTGRGSKPRWLVAALATGQPLESLAVGGATAKATAANGRVTSKAAGSTPKTMKRPSPTKYSDGTHTWSGRGPKPGWVKAAIAGGKTLEQLAA